MSHLDSSALATYNSLIDPHLQCYFSNERIRSHLKNAGLISRRGEIVSDSEYRFKLARREHKRHVRQMLAENIVHRAVDMERARQAELKRQLDIISKAALVNSVKESRRRARYSTEHLSPTNDMGLLSMNSSWSQTRPKSANHHRHMEMINDEHGEQPRAQSAHMHENDRRKPLSKSPSRRSRYLSRPKSSGVQRSTALQRPRSPMKPSESSLSIPPCQITMIYHGPHTKVDYDQTLFEPVDEIMVMQQHCGGENLIVYKDNLKPGEEFTFNSRRHVDYPFGLSIYVKGLIDSRISTCCEYKHRHGVRLGGERGHFAILSVQGSKPCLKCRFDKQARLKQHEDSNETDDDNKKPITISIPVSDQPKTKQRPVKIPVRHTPTSNENYSDDFDRSDQDEKQTKKTKQNRLKSPTDSSLTSTVKSEEDTSTKTWQVTFHTTNIPTGSLNLPKKNSINALLKFSFISIDDNDETESYEINIKDFPQCFKSSRQDSFPAKLKNIGKPQQIRLKLYVTGHDNEEIKWHLNYVEIIDPQTQTHYKFPCNQWIRPSEEKILNHEGAARKASASTSSSKSSTRKPQSPIIEKARKVSTHSISSSSNASPHRFELIQKPTNNQTRRISTDNESTDQKNKIHYRITIYPSNDANGDFHASSDSRIFLRLNNQTKDSYLYKKDTKYCPSFEAGKSQTFEIVLKQNANEKPTKLTIGYYNPDIDAGKWKIQKIVLINTQTGEETVFPCKQALTRNDFNLRAEQTFQVQTNQSDDDEEQATPRNTNAPKHIASPADSDDDDFQQKPVQSTTYTHNRSPSPQSTPQKTIKKQISNEKPSSSSRSSQRSNDNNNNQYKKKSPDQNDELSSPVNRPKTRRGREDTFEKANEGDNPLPQGQRTSDIWRPSSQLEQKGPVDPLIGLDDIQDPSPTLNEEKKSSTNSENSPNAFKNWYPKDENDEDDDDD